jgi:hypothetical protein
MDRKSTGFINLVLIRRRKMIRIKPVYLTILCIAIVLLTSACQSSSVPQDADEPGVIIESTEAIPPTPAYPSNLLFLGNTLIGGNGGVENHLKNLVAENAALPDIEVVTTYQPYTSIDKLWSKSEGKFARTDFNCVVVFETFQNIWENGNGKDAFFEHVTLIDSEVKKSGSETVLLMGWGYGGNYDVFTKDIADAHAEIGETLGIKVAPVGLALEAAQRERPDYVLLEPNNIDLNWRGTYLATLVLYATIYGQNPDGFTYQPAHLYEAIESIAYKAEGWQMTSDELSFLQRIAWETVTGYPLAGVMANTP